MVAPSPFVCCVDNVPLRLEAKVMEMKTRNREGEAGGRSVLNEGTAALDTGGNGLTDAMEGVKLT